MPLTASDRQNLQSFVNNHDRYGYWNHLSQKGDPYAKLALGVVTNETYGGYVANHYAAGRAAVLGKTLTDQQWWDIGEASHVAISRYGFLTYPYLGEVRISAGNRKFCEALSSKPSEREKSAMAYMAANGIDPNAKDFERFCRVLSNPRQILAPTEHARSLIAELKPQIEKLRAEQYAIWMREAEKRAPYDLMRSYQPVSTQEPW